MFGLQEDADEREAKATFKRLARELEADQPRYEELLEAARVLGVVGRGEHGTDLAIRSSAELLTQRKLA